MKAKLVSFGHLEIDGETYRKDVVVDGGRIRKRDKGPSKALHHKWGHTPLTAAEEIPWGGKRLIVGTGVHGELPIWPDLGEEAACWRQAYLGMNPPVMAALNGDVDKERSAAR